MKKMFVQFVLITFIIVVCFVFASYLDQSTINLDKEYGSVWYANEEKQIRVLSSEDKEIYEIYVCCFDPDTGAVVDIIDYGSYHEETIEYGVRNAISYYFL